MNMKSKIETQSGLLVSDYMDKQNSDKAKKEAKKEKLALKKARDESLVQLTQSDLDKLYSTINALKIKSDRKPKGNTKSLNDQGSTKRKGVSSSPKGKQGKPRKRN